MNKSIKRIINFSAYVSINTFTLLSAYAVASPLDHIQPGTWYQVPNSQLKHLSPKPLPPGYQSAIMKSWGGAAFDTKRDRLIVWGGGHKNYAGNEIYAFSLSTLKWSRITEPSSNVGGDRKSGIYPDGKPRSRHTYNYIEYLPNIDRFVSIGGAGTYPGGLSQDRKIFEFDFEKKKWSSNRAIAPKGGTVSSIALYDPASGHLFRHSTMANKAGLDEYDPIGDRWIKHARFRLRYYMTAALDPQRRYIVAIGRGRKPLRWDLSRPGLPPTTIKTSGQKEIEQTTSPGFVFDRVNKCFIAWSGGEDVYALNPENWRWIRVQNASNNTVVPTVAQKNGTYGRFRYVPSRNIFVAVNSTSDNVYFYKPPLKLW